MSVQILSHGRKEGVDLEQPPAVDCADCFTAARMHHQTRSDNFSDQGKKPTSLSDWAAVRRGRTRHSSAISAIVRYIIGSVISPISLNNKPTER